MQSKSILRWGVAATSAIVIAGVITLAVVIWQFLPVIPDPMAFKAMTGGAEATTFTPVPIIERIPLPTAPARGASNLSPTLPLTPTLAIDPLTSTLSTEPLKVGQEAVHASPLQLSTEQILTQAILPERDQRLLAIRLKHKGADIPLSATRIKTDFQLGDNETFWVTDNGQSPPRQFQAKATLKYRTDHSYWWVEDNLSFDMEALKRSAERFETHTYPTNRAFFGGEWSPGVDHDVRIHIFLGRVPGVAGYFSASNSYSTLAEPFSNEKEMFFINLNAIAPGNDYFDGVLAHEFQHMIHWRQDRNEETWVNEGLSELATFINGYGLSSFVGAYAHMPDTQLNSWTSHSNNTLAHYGSSFLFMAYFLQRYGEEMTQAVVANPNNGLAGFNAVLAEHGYEERFDDIFTNFLVANYLNDHTLGAGLWGYNNLSVNPVTVGARYSVYPVEQQTTVFQYGGDYIELAGAGDVTIEFTGSTRVKVVNNEAHSGDFQWYSHRGDDTNTRLSRAFDLSQVMTATLKYWTWYDLEADWDYGYVEVSADQGKTWTILQPPNSAITNPSGNAFGPGYTGVSGQGPIWLEESIDLSGYAGQEILIRFEYVTDDAVNRPGWTIDDISIPEIGFYDDVENGPNGWQAEGFARIDNILTQRFSVQLVEIGDEIKVRPVYLDETNYGRTTVENLGSTIEKAVLIVSGLTPITTEPASYEYKLMP